MAGKNPAVAVAKEISRDGDERIVTLCTGVRARLQGVASSLINEAMMQIPDPPVPVVRREDGSQEENPWDPEYEVAKSRVEAERLAAMMDATIMFGVTLLDDFDSDPSWEKKIRWMEKHGKIDLSEYDLTDALDREFIYKKYVAVTIEEINLIQKLSRVPEEEINAQINSFPSSS